MIVASKELSIEQINACFYEAYEIKVHNYLYLSGGLWHCIICKSYVRLAVHGIFCILSNLYRKTFNKLNFNKELSRNY